VPGGAWTGARTGGSELGVETFAHDALETHAGADEPDGDKGEGVAPGGVAAVIGDAARAAVPEEEGAAHGEEGLDKGAERHPHAGLAPDLVPDASEEGAKDEGEHGAEGLLIGDVEGGVVLAVEEPCQGQCKLGRGSAGARGRDDGRTCTELPVWKAHQTNIAEKDTASLRGVSDRRDRAKKDVHEAGHEAVRGQRCRRLRRVDLLCQKGSDGPHPQQIGGFDIAGGLGEGEIALGCSRGLGRCLCLFVCGCGGWLGHQTR
jgi:hypothetical protein